MVSESSILFYVGRAEVSPADVIAFADGRYRAILDQSDEFEAKISRGADLVRRRTAVGGRVRGMTSEMRIAEDDTATGEQRARLGFVRHHGCGIGDPLGDREAAAVLVTRLVSLARGFSGVRLQLLELLCEMLNLRVLPRVPRHGSAGATNDAVPLSYLAAAVSGDREVSYLGRLVQASEALRAARLEPLALSPKEALALMGGTSVMTGLGCIAWDRTRRFARFATALCGMAMDVTHAGAAHLDPRIDALKPHAGTRVVCEWLRDDVEYDARASAPLVAAAPELLRACGHVVGTLVDANRVLEQVLRVEINSVCDEPAVHPATGEFLLGGNFHGGHVAWALDAHNAALASTVALLGRVLGLVCDAAHSAGLPQDLAPAHDGPSHGFRAMRGATAGLVAEVARYAMPAALLSPFAAIDGTEPASVGTIAAVDALAALDLAETIAAMVALAMCQAVDLRDGEGCHKRAKAVYGAVRQLVPRLQGDRAQDRDITTVLELFRAGLLPVGAYA